MIKGMTPAAAALLCFGMLTGCTEQSVRIANTDTISPAKIAVISATPTMDNTAAYKKLISFKTKDYALESIAIFNRSLTPENGNLIELLAAHADVLTTLSRDDVNFDFITLTLTASLDELYCEQIGDEISFSGYVKKAARPVEPLNEEEKQLREDSAYEFIFSAFYTIHYTITDPENLTVAERDTTLRTFHTEFQGYIDGRSEGELMDGNIKGMVSGRAEKIANSLSTRGLELSCEISSIEVHHAGADVHMTGL